MPTTAPSAASSTTHSAAIPAESTAASSAAPSAATLPTPSTVSAPCLIGYLQNVSSNIISSKGSEYFSFMVQKHDSSVKAVCFSPKKHKQQAESKAESCSPCKLTKFVPHPSEKDVIWVNKNTEIDDARDTEVNFSFRKIENETAAITTTKDVAEIKVNQIVTIRGLLLFGDKKPEQVPSRPNLTKLETSLVDDHGSIPVMLWNEQISTARDGQHYEIQNIRVLQYNGQKYLSSTTETKLLPSKHQLGQLQPQAIQQAKETLKRQLQEGEVLCDQVLTVEILKYFTCVSCKKKVQSRQESPVLKCTNCNCHFLKDRSTKTTAARISVEGDGQTSWYTLFTPSIQAIVDNVSTNTNGNNVDQMDEEQLSQVIVLCKRLKFTVTPTNIITNFTFT